MRLLPLAAIACLLAGAAQAQTLRIGLAEDPDALDPTTARTFVGRIVFSALCDKLVEITPDLKTVPQLATEWAWSADKKSLTMKLRQGVVFHDGEPLNAEAVKFSLERHLKMPGSSRRSEIAAMDSVEAVDASTVKINLKQPSAPFLAQLTDRAGMIVSPKAAQALGDKFASQPVCAGPFKFVERIAQDRIVLDRFDRYWDKDRIKVQRVVYLPIPDDTVRLANLKAGQLDLIERTAATDVGEVRKDSRLKLAPIPELGYQTITFNVANGAKANSAIGKDKRVRQAFELAIDREVLNQVVFNGEYKVGNQWVSPDHWAYAKSLPPTKRDVNKAKQLLKDAGVPNPTVTLMTPTRSETQRIAEVVQAMTKEAGFDVKIQATEFATSLDLADKGDFEAYLLAWSGRTDPDGNITSHFQCGAPLNYPRWCNKDHDALQAKANTVDDVAERQKLYAEAVKIALDELPRVFLYHRMHLFTHTAKLAGFAPYPDGLIRVQGLTLQ